MKTVNVMRHRDGVRLGEVEISEADWKLYEAGRHPAYQWDEGIAVAGDVLTDGQIEDIGVHPTTVIFLED